MVVEAVEDLQVHQVGNVRWQAFKWQGKENNVIQKPHSFTRLNQEKNQADLEHTFLKVRTII